MRSAAVLIVFSAVCSGPFHTTAAAMSATACLDEVSHRPLWRSDVFSQPMSNVRHRSGKITADVTA